MQPITTSMVEMGMTSSKQVVEADFSMEKTVMTPSMEEKDKTVYMDKLEMTF